MPGQLFIDRELDFRNVLHRWNVGGPMMERKRHQWDRFTGIALDTTNLWATSVPGTSETIAISEVQGGSVLMTTGTVDNDSEMLSTAVIYTADKLAIVEFRLTITDVSGTAVYVGFSDAKLESNGAIAIHYADNTVGGDATDAVGFIIDADYANPSRIMCSGVKNGTRVTAVSTGVDWADGETRTLRVELDADGGAIYYVDGVGKAYIANTVTDSTLLCCTIQAMTRAADGANTVRVRSFDGWQDD